MKEILIIDTRILCVMLDVPGKETCGTKGDLWDKKRVDEIIEFEKKKDTLFVLPLAVIIETGNHIAQAHNAWTCANSLCEIIKDTLDAASPWVEFTQQNILWNPENLRRLANEWPEYAKSGLSIGDMTIKTVAEFYAEARYSVHIFTGDAGLKAYEPEPPQIIPRRYMRK